MSKLPQLGNVVQLFGVGCEGCGHFRGLFEVGSVSDNGVTKMVLEPRDIQCEGAVDRADFSHLTLVWDRDLECWQADCHGNPLVVNIDGHFRGPSRAAA